VDVAQRVVLHVGSMKSGTSYLQAVMMANRALLAERGVMLPGRRWRDQVSGVADVLGRTRVAVPPREGAWQDLVDEIAGWDRTGLISMEFLGPIGLKRIDRVVSSFPEGTVEVVVTARDLNRNIPAMWQESVKNGRFSTFDAYVAAIRDGEGPGKAFWREQTIAAMCRRWSEVVGVDRVTVVTVPPPGAPREELWRRFCLAVGVDGADVASPEAANESLGAISVEVLRRLNERLADLSFQEYAPVVKHGLAKKVLARRRAEEPAVGFPVPRWLPALSDAMIARLDELGVRVVGDLADLRPVEVPGVDPGVLASEQHLAAALDALETFVRRLVGEGGGASRAAVSPS
jgi:hypothetical protein